MIRAVAHQSSRRLLPLAGERSISNAMMMPITGTIVHCPANQCCTAVYHSSVVGRNTKPSTGHKGLLKTLNQCENSHTSTITTRGTHSASNTSKHGMAESFRGFGHLDATRSDVGRAGRRERIHLRLQVGRANPDISMLGSPGCSTGSTQPTKAGRLSRPAESLS